MSQTRRLETGEPLRAEPWDMAARLTEWAQRLRLPGGEKAMYLVPVAVAVTISQLWFRAGRFVAGGDLPPFLATGLEPEYGSHWNHLVTGAGAPNYQVSLATQVLFVKVVRSLGGSEYAAQRLFYAVLVAAIAFATAYFVRAFVSDPVPVAVAGLAGVVNPFVMTQVMNPLALVALALMGLLGGMLLRVGRGERVSPLAFAFVTLGCSYLALNPPLLLVVAIWVLVLALVASRSEAGSATMRFLARAGPWSLVLNLWWLVPMLLTLLGPTTGSTFAAQTDVLAWSWTHVRNSIPNVLSLNTSWAWRYAEYFPYATDLDRSAWAWMRFVLPATALAAPLVTAGRTRRAAVGLVGAVLALAFLGKGLHPPIAGVNVWLYDHVPGLWLLREPMSKLGPAIVLLLVALFAMATAALITRSRDLGRHAHRGVLLSLGIGTAAVLAYPYPMWNGNVVPTTRPSLPSAHVRVPEAWSEAAAFVNGQPMSGKVLMLPVNDYYQMPTTWGYYGIDFLPQLLLRRPVIQLLPETYYSDEGGFAQLLREVESSLVAGDTEGIPRMLDALGVSHVLLRRDLELGYPGRSFVDPARLAAGLSVAPRLRLARSFGVVDVYEVARPTGIVSAVGASAGSGSVGGSPVVRWGMVDPSRYVVEIERAASPFVLRLAESYADGWTIGGAPEGAARHVRLDGYANGWVIRAGGDLSLELAYAPAAWAGTALVTSQIGIVVGAFVGCVGLHRRRQAARTATSEPERG